MASSSKKMHVRSNSLQSRSNPSTVRLDEELNKLRVLEASTASTSDSIYKGLSGLEGFDICVQDLLNLSSTQQMLSQHAHEKCIEELLEGSVRILDVCEVTRDILVQIKEQIKGLQSALRRRKGDSNIESSIISFISFRKKMKKDGKKLITSLKKLNNTCQVMDLDSDLIATLKKVIFINVSIFQSLLAFLSVSKPKSWSSISKLTHKEKVACEEKLTNVNELESVDVALMRLCKSGATDENLHSAQERLEALDMAIGGFESSLESVFRRLIKTRASVLNIISLV